MVEYIERNALIAKFKRLTLGENSLVERLFADGVYAVIETFPAADVVEVRHGIWIGIEYDGYADGYPVYDLWECSECGEEVRGDDVPSTHPWCHSCGARMDKEDDHEISKP